MAEFIEIKIPEKAMEKYLSQKEGQKVKILKYKKLGAGWHGTGYEITYQLGKSIKIVILRTLRPAGFSHDYPADRGKVFLLQHAHAKLIPKHIESLDVGGYAPERKLVSLGEILEFFQIVEKAEGLVYMDELKRIKGTGQLTRENKNQALILSEYLVSLHQKKYKGDKKLAESLYKRHLRDCVGHGEMLMGVIDTYPEKVDFATADEISETICQAVRFKEKIKGKSYRLCRMHGDFHPGNIIFKGKDFQVLDASRELWGDPADDLTTLAINHIWFAIMHKGDFSGPFAEIFKIFWNNYMQKTKDNEILEIVPLFFAFRGMVVIHPIFYPEQSSQVRRKIFNFVKNALTAKKFDPTAINRLIKP